MGNRLLAQTLCLLKKYFYSFYILLEFVIDGRKAVPGELPLRGEEVLRLSDYYYLKVLLPLASLTNCSQNGIFSPLVLYKKVVHFQFVTSQCLSSNI